MMGFAKKAREERAFFALPILHRVPSLRRTLKRRLQQSPAFTEFVQCSLQFAQILARHPTRQNQPIGYGRTSLLARLWWFRRPAPLPVTKQRRQQAERFA